MTSSTKPEKGRHQTSGGC